MDKTKLYIKMCDKTTKLQEYYFTRRDDNFSLLPSYVFSRRNDILTVSIEIWTPKLLKEILGNKYDALVVNTEYDNDKMVDLPETDKLAIDSHTWLPMQDQLQEMLDLPKSSVHAQQLFEKMIQFMTDDDGTMNTYASNFTTPEQLWLALLMKEKYNEVWDFDEADWVEK